MWIIKNRIIFYVISVILLVGSLGAVATWGLELGIDFKGGSLLEVTYPSGRPDIATVEARLAAAEGELKLGAYVMRPIGTNDISIKSRLLSETDRATLSAVLSDNGALQTEVKRFTSVGPLIGAEAKKNAFWSISLVVLCIILYITFVFRKVSRPVASWKYGVTAIVALAHDVIIPTGVFAFLGHYLGYEVDALFVTALLVILGFSIHDTIVVFDRVRENLRRANSLKTSEDFEKVVGESVGQTVVRSINTSLTTIIALAILYVFGAEATKHFSLTLMIGIAIGTYSSIFIASALLVTLERLQKKN